MKNIKGFTIVELIAIIVVLFAIGMLIYTNVSKIIERQKINTFKQSLNGIIDSVVTYATDNQYIFQPNGESVVYDNINDKYIIDLKSDLIKMNSNSQIASGWVIVNSDNTIEVYHIYNGRYCALSGTTGDFEIKKGQC